MIQPIHLISTTSIPDRSVQKSTGEGGGKFQSLLESAVREVEDCRSKAQQSTLAFLNGESKDIHSVLLDVQRAELTFDLFIQVKNKVTQAYQEIMRMPL